MRLSTLICFSVLGLSACQTHTISEQSQELARLQQDRARLNRVYATAETTILEQQKTDAAYAAARTHFQILRQLRFKACKAPASPNMTLRLQLIQCQYAALNQDYQQLYHWQHSHYQFPPRVAVPQN